MSPLSVRTALIAVSASLLICPPADCQPSSQAAPKGDVLSFSDTEVPQALTEIEEHFGVKIISYGKLDEKVTATLRDPDIAQALTSVTSPFGYKWRKVTLAVEEGEQVSPATLRDTVNYLEKLDASGAVVDDPVRNTRLAFRRNPDDSPDLEGQSLPTGEVYRTYYFVYNPKPSIVFAPPRPPKGLMAQRGGSPTTIEGLVDWFASLDHEAQSQLLGQLMSSMSSVGMGAFSLAIKVGEGDELGEHNAIFIRKLEVGEGGGE